MTFRTRLFIGAWLVMFIGGAPGTSQAQTFFENLARGLGFGRQAVPVPQALDPEDPDLVNEFSPKLNQLLKAELYFVQKVCQPNAEQLTEFQKTGKAEIVSIAKLMAQKQNQQHTEEFPQPRKLLTAAFVKKGTEILPPEAAKRYQDEIELRVKDRQETNASLMVSQIDRELHLTETQFQDIQAAVQKDWRPEWSRNVMVFFYPDHAPWPAFKTIRPYLDEKQQTLSQNNANRSTIFFGWESDLGLDGWVRLQSTAELFQSTWNSAMEQKP
ncbi:hypothetical protein SH661x_000365 [Planctomicrobium sp. SH661]|uniref:hypothetical protein n=1 Tax=Planctomicrobium sp. SH661 TaxID=3448124 RepID=UPI003F5C2B10